MATRKKKSDVIMSADIAEMTEPKVVKGSHLTVTTYPDGHTELLWDDEALMRDVREALLKAESVVPVTDVKPKRKAKAKS
jgi:hypothetical protein